MDHTNIDANLILCRSSNWSIKMRSRSMHFAVTERQMQSKSASYIVNLLLHTSNSVDLIGSSLNRPDSETVLFQWSSGSESDPHGEVLHCGNWELLGVSKHRMVSVDPAGMRNYLHWDPYEPGEPCFSLFLHLSLHISEAALDFSVRTVASQFSWFLSPWPLCFLVNLWEPWFWTAASVPTTRLVRK